MKAGLVVSALAACFFLSGCLSTKSIVDPTFPKVSYEDLKKRSAPYKLKLQVEFQRNGKHYPAADKTLRENTEKVLNDSGVVTPVTTQEEGDIKVVVNNIADLGEAAKKGFGTGLTFGMSGSTVTDAYEMSLSITANGKTVSRSAVKHAIHSGIGNTTMPEGSEVVPPNVAFSKVVEQMLLRSLKDMQDSGDLAWLLGTSKLLALHRQD